MCYDANVSKAWKQTKHTEVTLDFRYMLII